MAFFIQCVDPKTHKGLLGTDNNFIIRLKTLRGVLNRINKFNMTQGKPYEIYQFYGHILDLENNSGLVYTSYKED